MTELGIPGAYVQPEHMFDGELGSNSADVYREAGRLLPNMGAAAENQAGAIEVADFSGRPVAPGLQNLYFIAGRDVIRPATLSVPGAFLDTYTDVHNNIASQKVAFEN